MMTDSQRDLEAEAREILRQAEALAEDFGRLPGGMQGVSQASALEANLHALFQRAEAVVDEFVRLAELYRAGLLIREIAENAERHSDQARRAYRKAWEAHERYRDRVRLGP